jgi:hypothetical protein
MREPRDKRSRMVKNTDQMTFEIFEVESTVILPVLTGFSGRIHAAIFSF